MKKLFTAILSAILFFGLNAANAQTTSPNGGGMITFPVYGGPIANAFYIPAAGATDKVLILFHEWYGLTDNIKKEAQNWRELLGDNVAIYAIDLYDGKTAPDKFSGEKLMNNLDSIRANAIIEGLLQKIGNKQIATLGWGMGGTWAFTAAAIAGDKAVGCAMYYSYPVIKDDALIKRFKTDVVYVFANQDEYITRADMDNFGKKITGAGRGFIYETFNGVNGFANIGNPMFQKNAASETQNMVLRFLQHKLSLN